MHLHRDGLARLPRALKVNDLPAQTEKHEVVRLDVAMHDLVMGQGWGSRARVRAGRRVESRGEGWAEVGGKGWFDVAVRDVVGVQVLHDVRQPVDDELALIALQRALLEVVGERERAILEHHAVLLTVRVLIVVDELDDVLGAQLLEERDLAHEVLLG